MTSLAVEMAASRLLGNYFGTSNLVWASIIGLILIYLAAGHYLGGRWADRFPSYQTFYRVMLGAAITISLVPLASRPVLRFAADAFDQLQLGVLFGSFTAVLVLLLVPVILLGTISPYAIKLAIKDTREAGSVAGKIYAISTLGSFLGAFLPVLLFIPLIGTYRTFYAISGLLLLVALIGMWRSGDQKWSIGLSLLFVVLFALAVWGAAGQDKSSEGQIYETESTYNYIQVLEEGGYRMLRLNEGQGIHSFYHPVELNYYGPWEQVLVAPFYNAAPVRPDEIKNIAIVGLAAGTTARQAALVFPEVEIDGFEIDPKIVDVGRQYFDMNQPNLNVIIQDGRWGLDHSKKLYQVISVDAYRPPYIPWHLTTQEFFQIVHDHLTPDGVLVINIGRGPDDRRLIDALGTTVGTIFPSIHVMDIPNTFNSILFATVQPTTVQNLADNLAFLAGKNDTSPLLLESMILSYANIQPVPEETVVFTDDRAPIEWLTNAMVFDYFVKGGLELLQ
jgi:spermidine synthase